MNILIATYKADISGGSNRALLSVIDTLTEKHNITLLLPKKQGQMYEEAKKRNIECIYIPFSRIGFRKSNSKIKNIKNKVLMYAKLLHDYLISFSNSSKLKKMKFDIVYSNGNPIHIGRYLGRMLKIPHVWHIREFFDPNLIYPKNIFSLIEKDTEKTIVISTDMYEEIVGKFNNPDKLVMISDGMPYEKHPDKIQHEGFNMILTGRITEDKSQILALKALKKVIERKEDNNYIKLFFAGSAVNESDESYLKSLKDYIKNNKLNNYVEFLGEVNNINEIRTKMDVELMCSSREPFGRVTVEGMRSGLGVIGSNSGGTKDIIIDGYNGLLFEKGNEDDLCEKIILLIDDRELLKKISNNGKDFSKTHFEDKQLLKTAQLIEKVGTKNE